MKAGLRYSVLSTAAIATLSGTGAYARDLVWDASGSSAANTPNHTDGPGNWDTLTKLWTDPVTGENVTWSNAIPDSATFGNSAPTTGAPVANNILLAENITVQNLTFGTASNNAYYNLYDQGDFGQTLTLNGNITKSTNRGGVQVLLSNALVLSAGQHTFKIADTGGDDAPEFIVDNALTGAGGVTINNDTYDTWGTTAFNVANTYTGDTIINKGRLIINTSNGLGATTAGTTIGARGTLAFAGAKTTVGNLTINEPISITRNTYTGGTFDEYRAAIIATNDGSSNTITLNGPLTLDSTDARVQANTNRIVINGSLVAGGATVAPADAVFTADGDFAGFIQLGGDNTAFGTAGGTIRVIGGVELEATTEANLGGPTSKLRFDGGTFHPIGGGITSFGSHVINDTTFNSGIDVDANQQFTIDRPLGQTTNAVGSLGKRGAGTLNINSTVNLRGGQTYFDSGTVNVNAPVTLANLHLRSPILNINQNGSVTLVSGYSSLGQDTTGTNGGPDIAVVNISGNGSLVQTNNDDFNISDNANTKGTINLSGNAVLTTTGATFLGKSPGTVGTITLKDNAALTTNSFMFVGQGNTGVGVVTQDGGSIKINRTGDFSFVLGDGRDGRVATGSYTLNNGTFTSVGEVFVGEGGSGVGNWTQTNGTAVVNNWFVVGRESGLGTVNISGGSLTKGGGGEFPVGEGNNTRNNTFTISGNGVVNVNTGQFWIANGGGKATLTVQDNGALTTNDWFAIGRGGNSIGLVNQSGGTVTKQGANFLAIGSGGSATYNLTGGKLISNGTRLAENSNGLLSISGASIAEFTGDFGLGFKDTAVGTLTIAGNAVVSLPNVVVGVNSTTAANGGVLNLDGGTLTAGSIVGGASTTALRNLNFNGGVLKPAAANTNFIGAKINGVVKTNGAKIDTNGFDVTINSTLVHDAALATTDGGLTKSGAGKLTLTGANTYNGTTVVAAGTLRANTAASNVLLNGTSGLDIRTGIVQLDYAGGSSPVAQVKSILTAGYTGNFATGQIRGTTLAAGQTLGYGDNGTDTVTVRVTLPGDAELDGDVDFNDFLVLQNNFAQTGTRFDQANFNYDNVTDFNDFLALQNFFGQSVSGDAVAFSDAQVAALTAFAASPLNQAVPEPASLTLIGLGAAGLMGRRRRAV